MCTRNHRVANPEVSRLIFWSSCWRLPIILTKLCVIFLGSAHLLYLWQFLVVVFWGTFVQEGRELCNRYPIYVVHILTTTSLFILIEVLARLIHPVHGCLLWITVEYIRVIHHHALVLFGDWSGVHWVVFIHAHFCVSTLWEHLLLSLLKSLLFGILFKELLVVFADHWCLYLLSRHLKLLLHELLDIICCSLIQVKSHLFNLGIVLSVLKGLFLLFLFCVTSCERRWFIRWEDVIKATWSATLVDYIASTLLF